MINLEGRYPGVVAVARYFEYAHLPAGPLRDTSSQCESLAVGMIVQLPDGPELAAGLRKLLEAKDCFVRAALDVKR